MDSSDLEHALIRRRASRALSLGVLGVSGLAALLGFFLISNASVAWVIIRGELLDPSRVLALAILPVGAWLGLVLVLFPRRLRGRGDLASIWEDAPRSIAMAVIGALGGMATLGGLMWFGGAELFADVVGGAPVVGLFGLVLFAAGLEARRGWAAGQRGWFWAYSSSGTIIGLTMWNAGLLLVESSSLTVAGLLWMLASIVSVGRTRRWAVAPLAQGDPEAVLARSWASRAPDLQRAIAALFAGDVEAASQRLDETIAAQRGMAGSAVPLALRGWLRLFEGELEAAGQDLQDSVKASRTSVAELGLAELRLRGGDWEAMNEHVRQAALIPGSLSWLGFSDESSVRRAFWSRCQVHAGQALSAEGLLREAREELADGDLLTRAVVDVCEGLGKEALGQHDAAREAFERVGARGPGHVARWVTAHRSATGAHPVGA